MGTVRMVAGVVALVAMLGAAFYAYQKISAAGKMEAEIAQLRTSLKLEEAARERARLAYEADLVQARQDRADKAALQGRVDGLLRYVDRIEGATLCLTDDDVDRLRELWNSQQAPAPTIIAP